MTVTELDPATALIVVDLQKGIASLPAAHPVEEVVANASRLAQTFREHGLPVVLVNVAGAPSGRTDRSREASARVFPPEFTELLPDLGRSADDILVTKRAWGAFTTTDLDTRLRSRSVTQVVVAGIATSVGVESTARHAHELGYNVTIATDAVTDREQTLHDHSVSIVFPRLGETGTTDDIIALLER